MSEHEGPRGRGRPRGGDIGGRERILAAATAQFGELGYQATTVRGIAEIAGVDPALVHHHFGTKAELFAAVVDVPTSPAEPLAQVLDGDLSQAGERLARFIVTTWDDPAFQSRGIAALREVLASGAGSSMMVGFVSAELMARISEALGGGEQGNLRAGLVASQVIGLMTARYVLGVPALAAAAPEQVIAAIGPTIQHYLTGDLT